MAPTPTYTVHTSASPLQTLLESAVTNAVVSVASSSATPVPSAFAMPTPETECPYPYTSVNCSVLYADLIGSAYYGFTYFETTFTCLLVVISLYSLIRVIQWRGWRKRCRQRTILIHVFVSSCLFLVRSIDSYGWQNMISPMAKQCIFGVSFTCQYLLIFAIVHGMSVVVLRQTNSHKHIVAMNVLYWTSLLIVPPMMLFLSIEITNGPAWLWGTARMGLTMALTFLWSGIHVASTIRLYHIITTSRRAIASGGSKHSVTAMGGPALHAGFDEDARTPVEGDIAPDGQHAYANPLRGLPGVAAAGAQTAAASSEIVASPPAPRSRPSSAAANSARTSTISISSAQRIQSGIVYAGMSASAQLQGGKSRSVRHDVMLRKVFRFLVVTSMLEIGVLGMQGYVILTYIWLKPIAHEYDEVPTYERFIWNVLFESAEMLLLVVSLYFFRPLAPHEMRNTRNFAGKFLLRADKKVSLEAGDSLSSLGSEGRAQMDGAERTSTCPEQDSGYHVVPTTGAVYGLSAASTGKCGGSAHIEADTEPTPTRLLSFIEEDGEESTSDDAMSQEMEMARSDMGSSETSHKGQGNATDSALQPMIRRRSCDWDGGATNDFDEEPTRRRRSSLGDVLARIASAVSSAATIGVAGRRESQGSVRI